MVTSFAASNVLGIIISTGILNVFSLSFAFLIPVFITFALAFAVIVSAKDIECGDWSEDWHIRCFLN